MNRILILLSVNLRIMSRKIYSWRFLQPFRRALLYLALGRNTYYYYYMCRTLQSDKRAPRARMIDIVVRKDAVEKRIEADWNKELTFLVKDVKADKR